MQSQTRRKTVSNFEVHWENRSQLYHGQYLYAVKCFLPDAGLLRKLDHKKIDSVIRWRNTRPRRGFVVQSIKPEQARALHDMCDLLLGLGDQWHKTCYIDHLHVYTNDQQHVQQLVSSPLVKYVYVTAANVNRPNDKILVTWPRASWRTYFRERVLTSEQTEVLRNFITSRRDHCKASRSFSRALVHAQWRCYVRYHYYIDHDDPQLPLLLSLACPDMIRRTVPIEAKYKHYGNHS